SPQADNDGQMRILFPKFLAQCAGAEQGEGWQGRDTDNTRGGQRKMLEGIVIRLLYRKTYRWNVNPLERLGQHCAREFIGLITGRDADSAGSYSGCVLGRRSRRVVQRGGVVGKAREVFNDLDYYLPHKVLVGLIQRAAVAV